MLTSTDAPQKTFLRVVTCYQSFNEFENDKSLTRYRTRQGKKVEMAKIKYVQCDNLRVLNNLHFLFLHIS